MWLVGGGSGHGFKHGPAMAERIAAAWDGGDAAARALRARRARARHLVAQRGLELDHMERSVRSGV